MCVFVYVYLCIFFYFFFTLLSVSSVVPLQAKRKFIIYFRMSTHSFWEFAVCCSIIFFHFYVLSIHYKLLNTLAAYTCAYKQLHTYIYVYVYECKHYICTYIYRYIQFSQPLPLFSMCMSPISYLAASQFNYSLSPNGQVPAGAWLKVQKHFRLNCSNTEFVAENLSLVSPRCVICCANTFVMLLILQAFVDMY